MRTSLSVFLLIAACTTPSPRHDPTSRGPRASDHLVMADDHSTRSTELGRWPDRKETQAPDGQLAAGNWSRSFNTTELEARRAQVHRGEAAALHAEYDEACKDRSSADIAMSPLRRYGKGGTPTHDGARVFLSSYPGRPDALMAEIRCHRAWMRLGHAAMDSCPLDLPGLNVHAHGDEGGVTVEISIKDPALVPELQRRTMLDLEGTRAHGGHD